MYKDRILDHYKNPRNSIPLGEGALTSGLINPSCGDQVIVELSLQKDCIHAISIRAKGCVLSIASASLLSEYVSQKTIASINDLDGTFMQELIGISLGPMRMQCATLALQAIKKTISQ